MITCVLDASLPSRTMAITSGYFQRDVLGHLKEPSDIQFKLLCTCQIEVKAHYRDDISELIDSYLIIQLSALSPASPRSRTP